MKDAAQLSKGAGVTLKNPLVIINGSYNDVRMGAEISSYLKGYDDPRISNYFVKAKNNGIEGYLCYSYEHSKYNRLLR